MKIFTEKDTADLNQQFIYKLRNLYTSDLELFHQIIDYIPQNYSINRRGSLDLVKYDSKGIGSSPEIIRLVEEGSSYLPEICSTELLEYITVKVNNFSLANDESVVCNYIQFIDLFGKRRYLYSDKIILDSDHFFNLGILFSDMGCIGNRMLDIFPDLDSSMIFWKRFQTLTRQEKKVLKLLAEGSTPISIGEILFISSHTVHTHKKNIYSKLGINKINELVRIATILQLLEA